MSDNNISDIDLLVRVGGSELHVDLSYDPKDNIETRMIENGNDEENNLLNRFKHMLEMDIINDVLELGESALSSDEACEELCVFVLNALEHFSIGHAALKARENRMTTTALVSATVWVPEADVTEYWVDDGYGNADVVQDVDWVQTVVGGYEIERVIEI